MERNLRLYPLYLAARNLLFWLPVFFLYFSSVLPVDQVLLLEAAYYAGVVLFEVPSGYFSDRVGRRPTLLIAAGATAAASVVFTTTASFGSFLVAQLLLAVGMAFNSGTDSSLLYDTLLARGRAAEFARREGEAHSWAFLALGGAALGGGLLAGFELRAAYAASALAALATLAVAWGFREPPVAGARAERPLRQLGAVGARLRQPVLAWIFAFAVAMTVFNHVPYEFFQPYLAFLFTSPGAEYAVTPLVSGILVAGMMGISAWVSRRAAGARERFGSAGTLLAAMLLQGAVIGGMALVVHPAILALILLRSVPMALSRPVQDAEVHPRVPSGLRATYLSVQSLAGRLAFAGALAISAWATRDLGQLTPASMARVLGGFAAVLVVTFLALAAARRALQTPVDGCPDPS